MTTYRIFESCTGHFLGLADGETEAEAIASFAEEAGMRADQLHALIERRS